jgi:hypothetical protein
MFATSIAISLADIVEARFPVSYSHVLICSDFKEAFETGQVRVKAILTLPHLVFNQH